MRVASGVRLAIFQHDMEGMRGRCWSCGVQITSKRIVPHKAALGGSSGGDTKTPRRVSKIKEKMTPEKGRGRKVAKVVAQDEIKGASTDGGAAEKRACEGSGVRGSCSSSRSSQGVGGRSDEGACKP